MAKSRAQSFSTISVARKARTGRNPRTGEAVNIERNIYRALRPEKNLD